MDKKKPTLEKIQEYLKKYNPLSLGDASVTLISEHNHLNYRVEKDGQTFYLRMINPESYRAGEWLELSEEHLILRYLRHTGLAPKSHYVDPERFALPLMIQEFIGDAVCFKNLKPLSQKHLIGAAEAIALLNSQNINPNNFPFREGFTRYSYLTSVKTWRMRLARIRESQQRDVLGWANKIEEIIQRAEKILERFEPLLRNAASSFNFDGAHCGNTYWRNDKVIFLDWQKVSYGDPAFTLARFLTGGVGRDGEVPSQDKEIMVEAYLKKREVPGFVGLLNQRLFERQVADLVWVLWDYVNEKKTEPVEKATSVTPRYERVRKLLEEH